MIVGILVTVFGLLLTSIGTIIVVLWRRQRQANRPPIVPDYQPRRRQRRVERVRARERGDTEVTDVLPLPGDQSGTPWSSQE
ncbi:hypothetical protein SAMN04487819_12224 [Actinopolyspora alba]|uniref:Uncharacterized protein n=1 Tax=Actinopolyspora alba TaxID=673379 RepID=A0A1I2CIA1_9ACTN|nr:hypothetical protein [Actinopolyspora alba]SFE67994.1 hypothetical protein SAMN04487819_12224 [Actinopolyspora alba]